jgi:CRISPR-associated endonuclease/helicase Cas3
MERALDKILNRGEGNDILSDSLVRRYLQKNKEKQDHIFIVFASPVAEVGRDHDYDWAVAEPSSMRSIIQLGGRIRRHRSGKYEITNMLILDKNIKAYKNRNICYEKPGFESEDFKLKYKSMTELLRYEEYVNINSIPRIVKNENFEPEEKLADLEHFRLQSVMMRGDSRKVDSADLFWETPVWLSGCMQMTKRFRDSPVEQEYVCRYDIDDETEQFYLFDKGEVTSSVSEEFKKIDIDLNNLDFFINMEYGEIIEDLADSFNMSVEDCSLKFGRFTLIKDENNNRRHLYNSYLGVFAE